MSVILQFECEAEDLERILEIHNQYKKSHKGKGSIYKTWTMADTIRLALKEVSEADK